MSCLRTTSSLYRRTRLSGALTLALVALGGAGAATADAQDASDVRHEAVASAVEMPAAFTYGAKSISRDAAAALDLSCNQTESGVTCYNSQGAALRAMGVGPEGTPAEAWASKRRGGPRAKAALYCEANNGRPLVLFEHGDYGGWNLNAFTRQQWHNLSGSYANNASSYRMGGHSGHISDNPNGGSWWYPGPTGICDEGAHMGAYNWTDRAESRYRN